MSIRYFEVMYDEACSSYLSSTAIADKDELEGRRFGGSHRDRSASAVR